VITLEHIRRTWGTFSLDATLRARPGEYLVILGPSGCGKSLLLGIAAGIYHPRRGRVLLDGQDVTHSPPEQRGLGFMFQRSALFPHMSVRKNIAFPLAVRGRPRAEQRRRVEELVNTLGLQGLVDRPINGLSGGEAQKVAIARALAPRPRVLLLDEPLSLVDHNGRLALQQELRELHASLGFSALHVTHNREEARALGNRCAVMLGGRIVQAGPTGEVFNSPRCLFVARFLGQPERPSPPGCSEACLAGTGACDLPPEED